MKENGQPGIPEAREKLIEIEAEIRSRAQALVELADDVALVRSWMHREKPALPKADPRRRAPWGDEINEALYEHKKANPKGTDFIEIGRQFRYENPGRISTAINAHARKLAGQEEA